MRRTIPLGEIDRARDAAWFLWCRVLDASVRHRRVLEGNAHHAPDAFHSGIKQVRVGQVRVGLLAKE